MLSCCHAGEVSVVSTDIAYVGWIVRYRAGVARYGFKLTYNNIYASVIKNKKSAAAGI